MFGTNQICGKSYFKDAPKNSLFVTSIFATLQGEGPFSGLPAVFVRLTKCNLQCSWCDTFFDDGTWMTFDEIDTKIAETVDAHWKNSGREVPSWAHTPYESGGTLKEYPNFVLVMTGGEPLLQDNIGEFMLYQLTQFKAVQVESNGIPDTMVPHGVTLVCSPKCSEKKNVAQKYLKPSKTILERADCLKFVMSADENSPYCEVPEWAHEWKQNNPNKEIYCSPMNIYNSLPQKIKLLRAESGVITMAERSTVDETIDFWESGVLNLAENEKNHKYTGRYCLDHGFRLNLQQHLYVGMA